MKLTSQTQKFALLGLMALVFAILLTVGNSEAADGDITGITSYNANVHTGPSQEYNVIDTVPGGTTVGLIARNDDETMLYVRGLNGDTYEGWVSRWAIANIETNVEPSRAVTVLQVWNTVLAGGVRNGGQRINEPAPAPTSVPAPAPEANPDPRGSTACGTNGAVASAMTVRWTHVYNASDHRARQTASLSHNTQVSPTARDASGCWVFVTFAGGSGWLPTNAINNTAILGHPVR